MMSPLLFWHAEKYLPCEHYCFVSMKDYRTVLWTSFATYGIPLSLLLIAYIRITVFIHLYTPAQQIMIQNSKKRDLIALRCIFITVALLLITGFPAIVLILLLLITGEEYPLINRMIWFFITLSLAGLTVSIVFTTPELKSIVIKRWFKTQVNPIRKGSNVQNIRRNRSNS